MGKVQVKVSSGKQGKKIAEGNPKVMIAQATSKPASKPVYKTRAKMTAHITINGKRRA